MSTHSELSTCAVNYDADRPVSENPVKVMDLTLRDGHQSLFATRGRTEDMVPVAEMMDEAGFWAMEVWGGATFDTMHRFLNEDPWERIRTLKRYIKKTPFSMLLRGQNLVGYRNYADDVARAFVGRAADNGMDMFRTFDALNDYRNFETVVPVIKEFGKHFQGCICYSMTEPRMGGDVYNIDYYVGKAKALEDMGADSICIKDMAGLIAPYDAYDLVKAIKAAVSIPILLHSHSTSGMASMSHLKAIEAGVDILDTCMSPYAYRTSHPAVEPLVMSLMGTNRDTGMDIKKLATINEVFETEIVPKYKHLLDDTKLSVIDINVLLHQTPGGMLSNLVNQLREMDALDRLDEVYAELPKVRKDLGQIPLVTPTSQIVGIQTVNNVLFDDENERYKMITAQVKDLCYGLYGKTAVPISEEVQKKALAGYDKGETPITCRPAEVIDSELEKAKEEIEGLAVDEEDLLTYAMFPVTGRKFLKWKYGKEEPPVETLPKTLKQATDELELVRRAKKGELIEKPVAGSVPEKGDNSRNFNVFVDGDYFSVDVDEPGGVPVAMLMQQAAVAMPAVAGAAGSVTSAAVPVAPAMPIAPMAPGAPAAPAAPMAPVAAAPAPAAAAPQPIVEAAKAVPSGSGVSINAPMPGMIVDYPVKLGDVVTEGDTVVVLEAMKMENNLAATASGIVKSIHFTSGDSVAKGDVLCVIE